MSSSDQYKQQIMNDLAGGNVESLDDAPSGNLEQQYENFDDFAQRSSADERRQSSRGNLSRFEPGEGDRKTVPDDALASADER